MARVCPYIFEKVGVNKHVAPLKRGRVGAVVNSLWSEDSNIKMKFLCCLLLLVANSAAQGKHAWNTL